MGAKRVPRSINAKEVAVLENISTKYRREGYEAGQIQKRARKTLVLREGQKTIGKLLKNFIVGV